MIDLTDSHAHLDDSSFDHDRQDVMRRARQVGVSRVVVPAIHRTSWEHIEQLCAECPEATPAYGLHPLYLDQHRPEHVDQLAAWLAEHRAVAVGEIGLDYFVEGLDRQQQQTYFEHQLRVAREADLPVIVHARRAMDEVTATLRRMGGLRGVVHSFSGSEQQAEQLWRLGFCIGIGGPVTYDRAQRLRRIVARMPIEHLLLETDAPDQPGACHRGQRNEPANLLDVLRVVAELRGSTEAEVAASTTANAKALFRLA